jgi:hypothetical protein
MMINNGVTLDYRILRRCLMVGAITVLLILVYSLIRYPAINDHTAGTLFFGVVVVGLASFYAFAALRWTQVDNSENSMALRVGTIFGLVCGGLWIVEQTAGNLMDTSSLLVQVLYYAATIGVFGASTLAGFVAAKRSGQIRNSLMAGLWNGIINGLIAFIFLMLITFVFPNAALIDPENVRVLTARGVTDISTMSVADSLAGAINHLWIGPLVGIVFGAIGGVVGAGSASS